MKVLIIHGPNMNLLGLFSNSRLTLDKLNRSIKRHIRNIDVEVKIDQTHDQKKFISLLHTNRNKVDAFILNIGAWHPNGHLIKETLNILKVPYVIVEYNDWKNNSVFESKNIIKKDSIEKSYIDAINKLIEK